MERPGREGKRNGDRNRGEGYDYLRFLLCAFTARKAKIIPMNKLFKLAG